MIVAVLGMALRAASSGPAIPVVDVFSKGEAGYFCIKIPDLVALASGRLLAFGEARLASCSDYATTHLVSKHSDDGGRTWSPLRLLHSEGPSVVGNAAPVQLPAWHAHHPSRVLVPFTVNNSRVGLLSSDDDGASWTPARDLSANATRPGWGWVGLGPPGGLVLAERAGWRGRVVVPGYHCGLHGLDGTFSHAHLLLSDDGGDTWRIGAELSNATDPFFTNECQAAELPGGEVLLSARTLVFSRAQATTADGGETLSAPVLVPSLPQPLDGVEGSVLRLGGRLLLTSLDEASVLGQRSNLTLHESTDQGRTWRATKVLDPGHAAYSALAPLANGSAAVLFERSSHTDVVFVPDHISFGIAALA